ncbi:YCR090C [Symbiodinium pilosum]|uniref:YCR090C protein n=1 Tax=Symbiodinium pilosum TaxID=2952 RepID=A0A812Y553_SYMPI|nr:YCR090C [Symbiodinium pilosum]
MVETLVVTRNFVGLLVIATVPGSVYFHGWYGLCISLGWACLGALVGVYGLMKGVKLRHPKLKLGSGVDVSFTKYFVFVMVAGMAACAVESWLAMDLENTGKRVSFMTGAFVGIFFEVAALLGLTVRAEDVGLSSCSRMNQIHRLAKAKNLWAVKAVLLTLRARELSALSSLMTRMGNTLCYVVTTLLKETRQGVTIDPTNEEEIPNSKGTANFLIKWEGAKAPSSISVVTPSRSTPIKDKDVKDKPLGQYSEGGSMQPVAVFDCRGAEPVKWYPLGVTVETSWGKFENVDLSDPDGWMECSENGDTATVADVSTSVRLRNKHAAISEMPQEHTIAAKAPQAHNAVWCGFASCIVRVVNLLGDADTTAAVAGLMAEPKQMAGALYGWQGIAGDDWGRGRLCDLQRWDPFAEIGVRAALLYHSFPAQREVQLRQSEGHATIRVFDQPDEKSRSIIGDIKSESCVQQVGLFGNFAKVVGEDLHSQEICGWVGIKNVLQEIGQKIDAGEEDEGSEGDATQNDIYECATRSAVPDSRSRERGGSSRRSLTTPPPATWAW